ncbi:hypothetical protein P4S68_05090 [Pseudoalteromonas sp. Hal099]
MVESQLQSSQFLPGLRDMPQRPEIRGERRSRPRSIWRNENDAHRPSMPRIMHYLMKTSSVFCGKLFEDLRMH